MSIPFTQYLRPDGRQKRILFEMPADIERLAIWLLQRGCRLEAEVLTTDQVSLTAEMDRDGEIEVLAHEIVSNGPPVVAAVERLIRTAHALEAHGCSDSATPSAT